MQQEQAQITIVAPARGVTIRLASIITGLSEKAIRRKIEDGKWIEGKEYHRRDGGIYVDLDGYYRWVRGQG
ncbi:MAG: hypothetical protein ABFC67_14670 [Mizugakiibacter sp.]|uniref:hypothetical protein n=1 Tax=Mizugakiibacter sp. TaxID=1972610 RepID=UPI00320CD53C